MINISVDNFNGSLTSFYRKSHSASHHSKKQEPFSFYIAPSLCHVRFGVCLNVGPSSIANHQETKTFVARKSPYILSLRVIALRFQKIGIVSGEEKGIQDGIENKVGSTEPDKEEKITGTLRVISN
jgi:hypothetical protein